MQLERAGDRRQETGDGRRAGKTGETQREGLRQAGRQDTRNEGMRGWGTRAEADDKWRSVLLFQGSWDPEIHLARPRDRRAHAMCCPVAFHARGPVSDSACPALGWASGDLWAPCETQPVLRAHGRARKGVGGMDERRADEAGLMGGRRPSTSTVEDTVCAAGTENSRPLYRCTVV